ALDAEAEHPEARAPQGGQPLRGHRIDTIGADELQVAGNTAALFGGHDTLTQRQNPAVASEAEDIVLEDDRAYARMGRNDTLDHVQALVGVQAGNGGDSALGLV